MESQQLIELTADIAAAHVANNRVAVADVAELISRVHTALATLGAEPEPAQEDHTRPTPAVSVRSSIKADYLVCLVCGRQQKTLKRHLAAAHGLDPQQYRAQYGLSREYPMIAPSYSEQRRQMAHSIGLGRKSNPKRRRVQPLKEPTPSPTRRKRK